MLLRTAQTAAVEPPFIPEKIHHSQDLDIPSPEASVLTGGEPIVRI
jgi:hypothetical protein